MTTYVNPGLDASGNGNNWTTNNINWTSSGTTYDVMTDVPTNTNATTANYCVLNPLTNYAGLTLSSANLNVSVGSGAAFKSVTSTMVLPSSGKYYFEFTGVTVEAGAGTGYQGVGITDVADAVSATYIGSTANSYAYFNLGYKANNGTLSAGYGATWTTGDVIGCAVDMDAGTITFYKNNVSQGVAYSGLSSARSYTPAISILGTTSNMALNCGQRPFAYTPPTGFVALNTFNLPTPTIGATASTQANKYFDALIWTGNGTTNTTFSQTGLGFAPDFVWAKKRSGGTSHLLYDVLRGPSTSSASKALSSDYTGAEGTQNDNTTNDYLSSFNSNGFSYYSGSSPAYFNTNGGTYVAWNWNAGGSTVTNTSGSISAQVRANTTAGFSIVTYTGTSASSATIGHGLGVKPAMIIWKSRSASNNWPVWHQSVSTSQLHLNETATAQGSWYTNYMGGTQPTSTVFTISNNGTGTDTQGNGVTYVAYCFSEVAGYSKFGSYTGNGSADGQFVYLGFRPRFVMVKQTGFANDWGIFDSSRNPSNAAQNILYPNLSNAEGVFSAGTPIDFLSNGFKLYANSLANSSAGGGGYIYAAFAETPFNYANAR